MSEKRVKEDLKFHAVTSTSYGFQCNSLAKFTDLQVQSDK